MPKDTKTAATAHQLARRADLDILLDEIMYLASRGYDSVIIKDDMNYQPSDPQEPRMKSRIVPFRRLLIDLVNRGFTIDIIGVASWDETGCNYRHHTMTSPEDYPDDIWSTTMIRVRW